MAYPSVSAIEYQSGEAMLEAARAIRQRLFNPARRGRETPQREPTPRPKTSGELKAERLAAEKAAKDANDRKWAEAFAEAMSADPLQIPETPRDMLKSLCAQHDVTISAIQGAQRNRVIVALRRQFIHAINDAWLAKGRPLNLEQLSRLFGDRDHTTIAHYLGGERKRKPKQSGLPTHIYKKPDCRNYEIQLKIYGTKHRVNWQVHDLETAIRVRDAGMAAIMCGIKDHGGVKHAGNLAMFTKGALQGGQAKDGV